MFCPECGSILKPKDGKFHCSSCKKDIDQKTEIREKSRKEIRKVGLVHEELATLPETNSECPECGNKRAFYWLVQTRAGDEAPTRFYKCAKCEHTWKEYY